MTDTFEVSDRYTATGRPHPNRWTICKGDCEGMGFYPTDDPTEWPPGTRPAGTPEPDGTPDDGWRFIKCPKCNGTGRRVSGLLGYVLDILHTFYYPFHFALWMPRHRFNDWTLWYAIRQVPRMFRNVWRDQARERVLIRRMRARQREKAQTA